MNCARTRIFIARPSVLHSVIERLRSNQSSVISGAKYDLSLITDYSITDHFLSGGHSEGETPDPIPNSAVKPLCADGTAGGSSWESRSLPELFKNAASPFRGRGVFFLDR